MRKHILKISLFAIVLVLVYNQSIGRGVPGMPATKKSNHLKKGKWIDLFDGQSLKGWHLFNRPNAEIKNWKVEDGMLACAEGKLGGFADLISDQSFENFELTWDWKIAQGSNTGIFYHVVENPAYVKPSVAAPEYQIIDDVSFPAKLEDWQMTGSDYAMHIPNNKKKLNPLGEWNSSKIVFKNGHVEHWLNGKLIVEFQAWTPDWEKKKAEGKWKDHPDYGVAKKGFIGIQDYGRKAWFKNIKIREL